MDVSESSSMPDLQKYRCNNDDFFQSNSEEVEVDEYFDKVKEAFNYVCQNPIDVETTIELEEFRKKLLKELENKYSSKNDMELYFFRTFIKFLMGLQKKLPVAQCLVNPAMAEWFYRFIYEFLNWGKQDLETTTEILDDILNQIREEVKRAKEARIEILFPNVEFNSRLNDALNWISELVGSVEVAFDWRLQNYQVYFSTHPESLKVQNNLFY